MNKEQTYHIDTTKEEAELFIDPPAEKKALFKLPKISMSFPKIFCVVFGAHLIIALFLFGTTLKVSAKEEDKKLLAGPTPTPVPVALPSPTPNVVIQEPVPKATNKPISKHTPVVPPVPPAPPKPTAKYTEQYVVKQGDNFNKIVKKFKLNAKKLQKINNIKDTNKIAVGQTLKLM